MDPERRSRWSRTLGMWVLAVALLAPAGASAQDAFRGPRIEHGPNGITITVMPGVVPVLRVPVPSFGAPIAPPPEVAPAAPVAPEPLFAIPEAPAPALPAGPGGRMFGVFVGITDYPNATDLPYCAEDALRMQRAFLNAGLMQPTDTVVLTNGAATRAALGNALERFHRQAAAGDTVVFFFSGHGNQVADDDGDEADGQDETILLADGAIRDDELRAALQPGPARDLVALDSCYSGGFASDLARLPDSVGFYASGEDQVSYVAPEFQAGGYLSYYLAQNITRMGGRPVPMWELQRDLASDFASSGASDRQTFTVGLSRSVNTRTVLFDAPSSARATMVAQR